VQCRCCRLRSLSRQHAADYAAPCGALEAVASPGRAATFSSDRGVASGADTASASIDELVYCSRRDSANTEGTRDGR
jgi:hypothetical protein